MPRPHIDYLQSQSLAWQPSHWPHLRGCYLKLLSRDPVSGAATALVRFPSGWAETRDAPLAVTEELFVLDGALELDGRRYLQDCYACFPAGRRQTDRRAPGGAVALAFYAAEPVRAAGDPGAEPPVETPCIDAFELAWESAGVDPAFGGAGHGCKRLGRGAGGLPATMLVATPPHLHPSGWCAPQELHACAEELFVLSGDLLCHAGQMSPGAYCFRPAGVAHGPYGSRGGCLALLRTHDAPLAVSFSQHELELARAPAYQPILPPALRAIGDHRWRAPDY